MTSLLPDAEAFRRLVSGTDRGARAALARAALAAASLPYAAAVSLRTIAYDRRMLPISRPSVPVVSVGNLTLGGSGKTPLVAWVAAHYAGRLDRLDRKRRVAIVSRGYGARDGETSDEAAELAILLPDVPHVADRDRVRGVARAVDEHGAEIVVLDDGFQHRRLARTLDIVTIDATDPFGCGHIFPRGLLREPLASLARADAVVLTRADMIDAAQRRDIALAFAAACRGRQPAVWMEACHGPRRLRTASGDVFPLERIAGRPVAAVSGIGNPAPFRRTLESLGARVVVHLRYPDHHAYSPADLDDIGMQAATAGAEWIVTTLKDLVKLREDTLGGMPLAAVEIELAFMSDAAPFVRLLEGASCVGSS